MRLFTVGIFCLLLCSACGKKTELWKFDAGETAKFQTNPVYSESLNAVIFWSSYSVEDNTTQESYVIPKVKTPSTGIQMELNKKAFRAVLRAVDCSTGNLLWTSPVLGESDQNISSPVLFEGKIYVGSDDGKLYELNAIDGTIRWSYDTKSWIYSTPFVNDTYITCANEDGKLFVFDRKKQQLLWTKHVGDTDKTWVIDKDIVYGATSNMLLAFRVTDGIALPSIEIADKFYDFNGLEQKNAPIQSEIVIKDGYAYFTAASNYLYKVNLAERTLAWQIHIGKVGFSSPVLAHNSVFIGTALKDVIQINDADGAIVQRYTTNHRWMDYALKLNRGGAINGTVTIDGATLYFGSYDYGFYAYSIETGKRLWKFAIKHHIDRTKPIITPDLVIFGADSHHLYALER